MQALLHIDYFEIAHGETKNSVPGSIKTFFYSLFGKNRKGIVHYLLDFLIKKISARLLNDFGALSLELEGIHTKLLNGELAIDSLGDAYKTTQKIIALLTSADELFSEIDYFDNELLKKELKNALNTCYLIEVELKELVFKDKKKSPPNDDLFQALAQKSKDSLSHSA